MDRPDAGAAAPPPHEPGGDGGDVPAARAQAPLSDLLPGGAQALSAEGEDALPHAPGAGRSHAAAPASGAGGGAAETPRFASIAQHRALEQRVEQRFEQLEQRVEQLDRDHQALMAQMMKRLQRTEDALEEGMRNIRALNDAGAAAPPPAAAADDDDDAAPGAGIPPGFDVSNADGAGAAETPPGPPLIPPGFGGTHAAPAEVPPGEAGAPPAAAAAADGAHEPRAALPGDVARELFASVLEVLRSAVPANEQTPFAGVYDACVPPGTADAGAADAAAADAGDGGDESGPAFTMSADDDDNRSLLEHIRRAGVHTYLPDRRVCPLIKKWRAAGGMRKLLDVATRIGARETRPDKWVDAARRRMRDPRLPASAGDDDDLPLVYTPVVFDSKMVASLLFADTDTWEAFRPMAAFAVAASAMLGYAAEARVASGATGDDAIDATHLNTSATCVMMVYYGSDDVRPVKNVYTKTESGGGRTIERYVSYHAAHYDGFAYGALALMSLVGDADFYYERGTGSGERRSDAARVTFARAEGACGVHPRAAQVRMDGAGAAAPRHGTNPRKATTVTMRAHLLCMPGREEAGRMVNVLCELMPKAATALDAVRERQMACAWYEGIANHVAGGRGAWRPFAAIWCSWDVNDTTSRLPPVHRRERDALAAMAEAARERSEYRGGGDDASGGDSGDRARGASGGVQTGPGPSGPPSEFGVVSPALEALMRDLEANDAGWRAIGRGRGALAGPRGGVRRPRGRVRRPGGYGCCHMCGAHERNAAALFHCDK